MTDLTLKDLRKAAKPYGAIITKERNGDTVDVSVEAPHRKIWAGAGVHVLIDASFYAEKPDYADLIERMEYGIEDCTDPDCEWCNSAEGE